MLFNPEEIQKQLDDYFIPLEPMMSGFRLVASRVKRGDLERCESVLNLVLPEPFKCLLMRYNFDDLTMGPIVFSGRADYLSTLIDLNLRERIEWEAQWWGTGERPRESVLIASSDPYSLLLSSPTGSISAFVSDDGWEGEVCVVASGFELFFRGLGTLVVKRLSEDTTIDLALDVAKAVGSSDEGKEFWRWLIA